MNSLPDGWGESAERIARHCARRSRGETPSLTIQDRYEAALSGLVEWISDHGWPDDDYRPLFSAASNAITAEHRQRSKHLQHIAYWAAPRGELDPIGESVTDRLAAHQLCWLFSDEQWAAIWALATVMVRDGSVREAAALLGIGEATLISRLVGARRRARAAWIVPGETPRGMYRPARGGVKNRYQVWRANQARATRRRTA